MSDRPQNRYASRCPLLCLIGRDMGEKCISQYDVESEGRSAGDNVKRREGWKQQVAAGVRTGECARARIRRMSLCGGCNESSLLRTKEKQVGK